MSEPTRFGVCAECGEPVIKSQRRPASRSGEHTSPAISVLVCSADASHSVSARPTP